MKPLLLRVLSVTLAMVSSAAAAAQPLPRVFYGPQERQAITALRRSGPVTDAAVHVAAVSASGSNGSAALSHSPRLEGISLAQGGGHFAWIGGKRYASGERLGQWQVYVFSRGVTLRGPGNAARQLRVGEALMPPGAGTAP